MILTLELNAEPKNTYNDIPYEMVIYVQLGIFNKFIVYKYIIQIRLEVHNVLTGSLCSTP